MAVIVHACMQSPVLAKMRMGAHAYMLSMVRAYNSEDNELTASLSSLESESSSMYCMIQARCRSFSALSFISASFLALLLFDGFTGA